MRQRRQLARVLKFWSLLEGAKAARLYQMHAAPLFLLETGHFYSRRHEAALTPCDLFACVN
jgi:hypothetical protein